MPLYEYLCKTCGESFEKMVRLSESDHIPACPHCESSDTHKKITTFASHGLSQSLAGSSGCSSSGGRFT